MVINTMNKMRPKDLIAMLMFGVMLLCIVKGAFCEELTFEGKMRRKPLEDQDESAPLFASEC